MKKNNPIHQSEKQKERSVFPGASKKRYWSLEEVLELEADDKAFEERDIMEIKQRILEDLPANILKGSKHRYTLFCFVTFNESRKKDIVEWLKHMPLTSAWEQQYSDTKGQGKEDAVSLSLSYEGYEFFCDPRKFEKLIPLSDDDIAAFKEGLAERCPNAFGKKKRLRVEDNYEKPAHALILIATNEDRLIELKEEKDGKKQHRGLMDFFMDRTAARRHSFETDYGDVFFEIGLRNPEGSDGPPREWFGFRDGISNPRFFHRSGLQDELGFEPEAPSTLNTALRVNRLSPKPYACGSFVVFLKLEQNVKAFEELVDELAEELDMEKNKDKVAAYLMGRYKDGTPLHKDFKYPAEGKTDLNHFDYEEDKNGAVCPLHAHIRKANPRDDCEKSWIVRRGAVYEHLRLKKKGLLFLSYQSSFRQFEDIVNRRLYGYNYGNKNMGKDILFLEKGEYQRSHRYLNSADNPINPYLKLKEDLVKFRGGQYFFASSISFIRVNLENCM